MEMRRHARKHSPLQAVCCLPGCSQLFICLWALNLHEREHYASKPTKPDTKTNEQTGVKHNNSPAGKTHPDRKPKDETAAATVNKTVSIKATHQSKGQPSQNISTTKHEKASSTTVRAPLLKQELKESSEEDSPVLKSLANTDTSAQPSGPTLRLRQTVRKVTKTNLAPVKSHKVISSSLLKHNIKVRYKFKKKQVKVNTEGPKRRGRPPKRRGRPPKAQKAVHDENTTTGQNSETVKEKMHQRSPTQLASSSNAAEISNVSKELKGEKSQQVGGDVKTTETSADESKSQRSMNKHVKQKRVLPKNSTPIGTANGLNQSTTTRADKTQKSTAVKIKLCKMKKRFSPKENGSQIASSDSRKSKRHKVTNGKANTEIKKKCPVKEPEAASKKPAKSNSVVPQVETKTPAATVENSADEEGKAQAGNTDSTQNCPGKSVSAVPADCLNETTALPAASGEKTQKVATGTKSEKLHIKKKEVKKEKNTHTPSSDSGKTNKKPKDVNKKEKKMVKERRPRKDGSKTSALKKTVKSKSVDQQDEAKAVLESAPDVEGKALNATLDSSVCPIPAATGSSSNDSTSPSTATEENVQKATKKEKSKKSNVTKNSDPDKAKKKRKVHKEGDSKTVKKRKVVSKGGDGKIVKEKCKDQGVPTEVQQPAAGKAEVLQSSLDEGKTEVETEFTLNGPRYSVKMNGQAVEEGKSTVCIDALAEYGKKPYLRPPPTAYLDEKYITMPKRRKEMPFFQLSQRSSPPEQAKLAAALQRQRCANCFTTFNSPEELRSHLQLQKCSNLFGFDSDDEGNS